MTDVLLSMLVEIFQKHPKAKKWRTTPLPLFPFLEELYENTIATGCFAKSAATPLTPVIESSQYNEDEYSQSTASEASSVEEAAKKVDVKIGNQKRKLDFNSPDTIIIPAEKPKKRVRENGTTKLAQSLGEMNNLVALELDLLQKDMSYRADMASASTGSVLCSTEMAADVINGLELTDDEKVEGFNIVVEDVKAKLFLRNKTSFASQMASSANRFIIIINFSNFIGK